MGILITGTGIETTNSGEQRNITHRWNMTVTGTQPTGQRPINRGVVTVTPSPFAVNATPTSSHFKWSIASWNNYTPANPPTAMGTVGRHAEFYTFTGFNLAVPTAFGWSQASLQGTITTSSQTMSYNSLSDYRLKENVTPVENGLDYIMPLRPRRFRWKGGFESVGFIAHEIQEDTTPTLSQTIVSGEKDECITYVNLYKNGEPLLDENGNIIKRLIPKGPECDMLSLEGVTWEIVEEIPDYQKIDTSTLISPLVASVQQLKKMIDTQKNKIENLKSKILLLEGSL